MTIHTTQDGWCSFAIAKPVPTHKYWTGHRGRDAVVLHTSEGSVQGLISEFLRGERLVSAHFGIARDGTIYQFVSLYDSAFSNGATFRNGSWFDPQNNKVTTSWLTTHGLSNPNWRTISIEHVGMHTQPWTPEMSKANMRLLCWIAERFPDLAPFTPGKTLIGHCDISPVTKAFCPGSLVDYAAIAARANGQLGALLTPGDRRNASSMLSPSSSILASPRACMEQILCYILTRDHGEYSDADIQDTIIPAYWHLCIEAGVDPLVAVAQMIHETGNLSSWWSQRDRRNPAGIGVTGEPGVGLSFPSWRYDAIPAHVGRLLAYALSNDQANPFQRGLIATALHWRGLPDGLRGIAPTIEGLEGRWAFPGTNYADRIAEIGRTIQRQPVEAGADAPPVV